MRRRFDSGNRLQASMMSFSEYFFVGGTMDVTDQPLATWNGPASQNGTQNYTLANSWSYVPGTFSVTLTYTLSTP